jgi:diguanylate cyclase (GGDEF)-like protein
MHNNTATKNLRIRYVIGLSAIALLVTASFITMQRVVSEQRHFSSLVNLAGHQAGLANRIAYFSSLMVTTDDEEEFAIARAQVGRTINKMRNTHHLLRHGDPQQGIPYITNPTLEMIFEDPMVGLDRALENFLGRAETLYATDIDRLNVRSISYIYLTTYGPHVLEPMLDAVVDEYQNVGSAAIRRIEHLEMVIWLTALVMLVLEVFFIFYPMEVHVRRAFHRLQNSVDELTKTRTRLLASQRLAMVGDWEFNVARRTLNWSEQVYAFCGVTPENFSPSRKTAFGLIHPGDRLLVKSSLLKVYKEHTPLNIEYRVVQPSGKERLFFQQSAVEVDDNGRVVSIRGTIQDITERKEMSTRFEKLSEHIPGFLFQLAIGPDKIPRLPFCSKGIIDMFGLQPELLHADSRQALELIHPLDQNRLKNSLGRSGSRLLTWHDQYRVNHPEKGVVWVEGQATPERLLDGSTLWHGYLWDITDRKKSEDQIRKLALYDPLTGVANRRLLKDRLEHAIATSTRNENYAALIMLDLDNFKTLNDTRGHDVGDSLLIEVARRLRSLTRETDTVARLGGDEFVVIAEWLDKDKMESEKIALALAEKIRYALSNPYFLGLEKQAHHASASIGVVLFQDNREGVSELLKRADLAMYQAKEFGRNRACLFSKQRQNAVYQRTALANDLKEALQNDQFSLYFQPQFSVAGKLCGAEALLRWMPPGRGPISPGDFIPVAEETGLILPIGEWVLKRACQYINLLCRHPLAEEFAVAVNISARQFSEKNFLENVQKILADNSVPLHRIKFELTESCLFQDLDRGHSILASLREMGIAIELDDFGTGYSSLNSLSKLPLSTIKLDRSLISGVAVGNGTDDAIVRAAIAMAKAMSMQIVAEGVETPAQKEFLCAEGCNILQGYLLARPMPFGQFLQFFESQLLWPEGSLLIEAA